MIARWTIASLALFIFGALCINPPAKSWWQSVPQVVITSGGSEGTVVFDVKGLSSNSGGGVTTYSTATFDSGVLTIGSGSNRALIISVNFIGSLTGTSTGVTATHNGTSMTALGNVTGTGGDVYTFGLTAPASGNATIAASWTGAGQVNISALAVTGANQAGGATTFTSVTTNTGNSATASTGAVTSPSNRIVFGAFSSVGSGFTTAGNTDIGKSNTGNVYDSAANYDVNNTNPTMTYSAGSASWTAIGVSIKGF